MLVQLYVHEDVLVQLYVHEDVLVQLHVHEDVSVQLYVDDALIRTMHIHRTDGIPSTADPYHG